MTKDKMVGYHHQLPELTQTHVHRVMMPSNHLILCRPLLFLPLIFPSIRVFSNESVLIGGQSIGASALASFLPKNTRAYLLQNGLVGSACSPRDSQDSSPTPQLKSINSSAQSFLYSPTLTSIHGHCKNHSLDQTDLCWQIMSLLLNMLSRLVITFLPRSKHLLTSWLQSPSSVIFQKE